MWSGFSTYTAIYLPRYQFLFRFPEFRNFNIPIHQPVAKQSRSILIYQFNPVHYLVGVRIVKTEIQDTYRKPLLDSHLKAARPDCIHYFPTQLILHYKKNVQSSIYCQVGILLRIFSNVSTKSFLLFDNFTPFSSHSIASVVLPILYNRFAYVSIELGWSP